MSLGRLATAVLFAAVVASGVALSADSLQPCVSKPGIAFCVTNTGRVYQLVGSDDGVQNFADTEVSICPWPSTVGRFYYLSDFVTVSYTQPNGVGTLPLTVVAISPDNTWQVRSTYAVNTADRELLHTIAVKRLAEGVETLRISYNIDDRPFGQLQHYAFNTPGTAVSLGGPSKTDLRRLLMYGLPTKTTPSDFSTLEGTPELSVGCHFGYSPPAAPYGHRSQTLTYYYPNGLAHGASKTVKFQFRLG